VLSLVEAGGVLGVEVEVEAFFSSSVLARSRDLLVYSGAFASASLTFFSISGFALQPDLRTSANR